MLWKDHSSDQSGRSTTLSVFSTLRHRFLFHCALLGPFQALPLKRCPSLPPCAKGNSGCSTSSKGTCFPGIHTRQSSKYTAFLLQHHAVRGLRNYVYLTYLALHTGILQDPHISQLSESFTVHSLLSSPLPLQLLVVWCVTTLLLAFCLFSHL